LVNFTAVNCNNQSVCLNWNTNNEVNVQQIDIEKSTNGKNFEKIHTVMAKNNPTNQYEYIDNSSGKAGVSLQYYRLKKIDKDERFVYSAVVSVNTKKENTSTVIFPNPAKEILFIQSTEKLIAVELINASGQIIKKWRINSTSKYNLEGIAKGSYFIKLYTDKKAETHKISVL
jgi:hypothetical protein